MSADWKAHTLTPPLVLHVRKLELFHVQAELREFNAQSRFRQEICENLVCGTTKPDVIFMALDGILDIITSKIRMF